MTCFTPLPCYAAPGGGITFKRSDSTGTLMSVPCGQCIGCRLRKSQEWAARITHEASLYTDNIFLTLTYDNDHLPPDQGLDPQNPTHFQKFIRSLSKRTGKKIRYFMCAEYGDQFGRPHYHAILFNYRPTDETFYKKTKGGILFTSDEIKISWGKGISAYGNVTLESAGYVARYTTKKLNGPALEIIDPKTGLKPYERLNHETGEIIPVRAEYNSMSLKPGIGREWFEKYKGMADTKTDFIIIKGKKVPLPNYYLNLLKDYDPETYERIKVERIEKMQDNSINNTPERLAVREKCQQAKNRQLKRTLA